MILKLSSLLLTCCCILQQQQMEDTRKAGSRDYMTPQHYADTPSSSFRLHCRVMEGLSATLFPDQPDQWYVQANYQLCSQQDVPATVNAMEFSDITDFMSSHYDPTQITEGTIQVLEHHQEEAWRDVDGTSS